MSKFIQNLFPSQMKCAYPEELELYFHELICFKECNTIEIYQKENVYALMK